MFNTIVALATSPLKSALAIIRLSGDDCFTVVQKIFSRNIKDVTSKEIFFGQIKDEDEIIDDVVVLVYAAPHGFTGENSVEIISHGSPLIEEQIIGLCIKNGATYATGGEFSSRAFLNNKMGLIEAEAINDVINATTAEAKKLAMYSMHGKTRELIEPLKIKIADILALIEVNIDYPEYEDIEVATKEKIEKDISAILLLLDKTIKNGYKGKIIKDGINVAIVGKPNAGKSSLLNALLNEKKAIVTSIPGTTRDIVEGSISLNGVAINLKDTAGIRDSKDEIEQEGIKKSLFALQDADLILYVVDSTDNDEDKELLEHIKNKNYIKIYNKIDLNPSEKQDGILLSTLSNNLDSLKDAILKKLNLREENYLNPSVNNVRELGLLEKIRAELKECIKENRENISLDLVAISLTDAYNDVQEILGETNTTDFSKEIFSRFCVGK
ncbi:MAG: tRNA uridine-5-carboxymethylaminomethyl(34) synthesis GTPase MnmE [Bacilli bacterium]